MNKVCVKGQRIYFYSRPEPIPKSQANFSRIEFDMDETWSSFLSVVAQFIQGGKPKNVQVKDGYCFVPPELGVGDFELCLRGDDGESVVASVNRLTFEVCEGFDPSGETPLPPSPDLYTQLIKEIDSGKKIAQSVRKDADSGKFNGPPGPPGPALSVTNTAAVGQMVKITAVDENGQPTEWEAVDIPEQVQADWNQNDETRNDYVKNRPFYLKDARETKIFELAFTVQTGLSYENFDGTNLGLEAGKEYTVNIMGQEFKVTAYVYEDGVVCIGDGDAAYNGTTDFSGDVPFGVGDFAGQGYVIVLSLPYLAESGLVSGVTDEIPVNIISEIQGVVPIDSKFLPKATLTSEGVISKYQVRNEIFINDLLNVFVNETTYKQLLEYLSNHVFSVIHCDSNISSNGVSLFVTYYSISISNKGVVQVKGNSIDGGNINEIYVVFPLNSDGSGIDDNALVESISPIIPNYILLGNNDKKFKITVDDSGTIIATEVM